MRVKAGRGKTGCITTAELEHTFFIPRFSDQTPEGADSLMPDPHATAKQKLHSTGLVPPIPRRKRVRSLGAIEIPPQRGYDAPASCSSPVGVCPRDEAYNTKTIRDMLLCFRLNPNSGDTVATTMYTKGI